MNSLGRTYLENRKQYVEIENYDWHTGFINIARSTPTLINHSIPQGSVLGCILFLIYINDLPKSINEACVLFADDISILTSCIDTHNLNNNLTDILNNIINWMTDHNLDLNFAKTKIMQFRPYQKAPLDINFVYNNNRLESIDAATLLGLQLDSYLNWKSHIQKIKTKLSSFVYALRELRRATDANTALTAYFAYAYSWFRYGIILWGNSSMIEDLFILQKKCIRILANIKTPNISKPYFHKPFFIKYKILTISSIYILETCKFVKKYPFFFKKETDMPRRYPTRFQHNLVMTKSRIKMHSSSPNSMAIKIFNKLPVGLKEEENEHTFEKSLKNLLIKKSYYSLDEFLKE